MLKQLLRGWVEAGAKAEISDSTPQRYSAVPCCKEYRTLFQGFHSLC